LLLFVRASPPTRAQPVFISGALMNMYIRPAQAEDIPAIAAVEALGFPAAEAATLPSFVARFAAFPECFFVAEAEGMVVGQVNGCVTTSPVLPDALYHDTSLHNAQGAYQTVFGLVVLPQWQGRGIASALMRHLIATAQGRGKRGVVLTCKAKLIPFYEALGFVHKGIADSCHGAAQWHTMLLEYAAKRA
jgi:predicted N-acetyltransferase YhbS